MSAVLDSLRRLILGETWTVPLGVGVALGLSIGIRALLPQGAWQAVGGLILAALLVAALVWSLKGRR